MEENNEVSEVFHRAWSLSSTGMKGVRVFMFDDLSDSKNVKFDCYDKQRLLRLMTCLIAMSSLIAVEFSNQTFLSDFLRACGQQAYEVCSPCNADTSYTQR
jgi:hypothetical protein